MFSSELNFYALENVCWKLPLVTLAFALLLGEDVWECCKVGHWVLLQPGIWPANASMDMLIQLATLVYKQQIIWPLLLSL